MKKITIGTMIAAAGEGKRMGMKKALLPLQNTNAVCLSARHLSALHPDSFLVTLPSSLLVDEHLMFALSEFNAVAIPNRYPKFGYLGSVKTVIEEVGHELDGIIINPVDSPLFSRGLVMSMAASAHARFPDPTILLPHYFASPGHPVYLSRHFFRDISAMGSEGSLRTLIAANRSLTCAIFWPDTRILLNLNSVQDLHRAPKKIN